jgi:hypothetical protein
MKTQAKLILTNKKVFYAEREMENKNLMENSLFKYLMFAIYVILFCTVFMNSSEKESPNISEICAECFHTLLQKVRNRSENEYFSRTTQCTYSINFRDMTCYALCFAFFIH